MLFSRYENTGFNEMSIDRFRCILCETDFQDAIENAADSNALQRLQQRSRVDRDLTYQEFIDLVRWLFKLFFFLIL
jgi:hypothetical protein